MRILVVGQGGREHAICWKLKQSPQVSEIYAAPGNAGIAGIADCVPIGVADIIELADFAEKLRIDLTVVGPELPLTLGIVDEFQKRGLCIFGPTRLAAELEGSKVFSKEFMRKYGIPTADAEICGTMDQAIAAVNRLGFPVVLKVDGLAAGKGVLIARSMSEAEPFLAEVFESRRFGNAADRLLVEEFLEGEEVSFMVLTDGRRIAPIVPAKDYKKAHDGDEGPNSGGMGSHSPAVVLPAEAANEIMQKIVIPTVQGMESEGRTYSGCLYVGLILTDDGPRVLEYNCRFGDPETQAQMMRFDDDLAAVLSAVARGSLGETKLNWRKEAAACVVVATAGYPESAERGLEVTIDVPEVDDESIVLFHAGTRLDDGRTVTAAGRVINACARGGSLTEALRKAYEGAARVHFDGAWYRTDIGRRVLEMRRTASGSTPLPKIG